VDSGSTTESREKYTNRKEKKNETCLENDGRNSAPRNEQEGGLKYMQAISSNSALRGASDGE
jgi:hypothetical protein